MPADQLELRGNGEGIIYVGDLASKGLCCKKLRQHAFDLLKLADKVEKAGF
jgi:hypothetical protein